MPTPDPNAPTPAEVFGFLDGLVGKVIAGFGTVTGATASADGTSAIVTNAAGETAEVTREVAPGWLPYAAGGAALLVLVLVVRR